MKLKNSLTKGTVPLMILEILRPGEAYGYEIVKAIKLRSEGAFEFGQGTIYPLLYKLQDRGYVTSERKPSGGGKERRYYRITDEGLKHLETAKKTWRETNNAIGRILGTESAGIVTLGNEI